MIKKLQRKSKVITSTITSSEAKMVGKNIEKSHECNK